MTREELIAALEAATGPSRKLDAEIDILALENGWRAERYMTPDTTPSYTASIDAALTLVPKWWAWGLCVNETGPGGAYCDMGEHRFAATHLIPAIAICTASLKARGEVTAPA
jgi:hypothetical protein